MFRDRRISWLIHALQVIYTLSILVRSHFAFPILVGFCLCFQSLSDLFLGLQSLLDSFNLVKYAYLRWHAVDIFLVKTPRKSFKTFPQSSKTKPSKVTIFGGWIVKSAHIILGMNSDFQGCQERSFWPTAIFFGPR